MLDVSLLQTAVVSLVSALIGGAFVHLLAIRRDRDLKRRELVTKHLLEIWHNMETSNQSENYLENFDRVVSDVQLFGKDEQIKLLQEIVFGLAKGKIMTTGALRKNLRDQLRYELGLPPTNVELFMNLDGGKLLSKNPIEFKDKK